jgi:hypothetical protein
LAGFNPTRAHGYTKDILKKFKMDDSKPLSTPMSTTTTLDTDEDGEPVDQKEYRDIVTTPSEIIP